MNDEPLRKVTTEAKLLLIGIPVLLWTLMPIYHLFLFAISTKEDGVRRPAVARAPDAAELRDRVPRSSTTTSSHFWRQLGNSLLIAVAVGVITLVDRHRRRRSRSAG